MRAFSFAAALLASVLSPVVVEAALLGAQSTYQVDGSPVRARVADFDLRNGLDVVVASDAGENGPSLSVLLNSGGASFPGESRINLDASRYIIHAVATGDFNGDGAADIAAAVSDASIFPIHTAVLVFRNKGTGDFWAPDTYPLAGTFPQCLEAGDVTGDGVLDLVVCHATVDTGQGLITVLPGTLTGAFAAPIGIRAGGLPTRLAIADLDADGRPDLVVGDPGAAKVFLLYGARTSLFEPPVTLAHVQSPSAVGAVRTAADSLADIVVTSQGAKQILTFRQTASRTFAAPVITGTDQPPADMASGDFNGDGIADVAVLGLPDGQLSVWLGRGDGSFAASDTAAIGDASNRMTVADVNGDGRPDVAVTSSTLDGLTLVLASGGAAVSPTPTVGVTTPTPTSVSTRPSPTATPPSNGSPAPTATATATPTVKLTATIGPPVGPGDANCDGRIDSADVSALITRLFEPGCSGADVDGDGRVTAADVVRLIDLLGSNQ